MRLKDFARNDYSQNGEDGIIEEILRLATPAMDSLRETRQAASQAERWCVEFGAWDGMYLSNTFALVQNQCFHAVYIEADARKYEDLERTACAHPMIIPMHARVSEESESDSSLDSLLERTEIPRVYDVLSVDVDSIDLGIWAGHRRYRPLVVVLEINSRISPGLLQWHDGESRIGSSFSSAVAVARAKGYTLVAHTGNCIFVADEIVPALGIDRLDAEFPERLFDQRWTGRRADLSRWVGIWRERILS